MRKKRNVGLLVKRVKTFNLSIGEQTTLLHSHSPNLMATHLMQTIPKTFMTMDFRHNYFVWFNSLQKRENLPTSTCLIIVHNK